MGGSAKLRTRLGAVMGQGTPTHTAIAKPETRRPDEGATPPRPRRARRQRITLWVSPEVCESFRDAVYGCPRCVTAAAMAEEALMWAVRRMETAHNGGKPFLPRPSAGAAFSDVIAPQTGG